MWVILDLLHELTNTRVSGLFHNCMSFRELLWRACTKCSGEKLDESWDADYIVEHVSSKLDCDDSEGTSRATRREWSIECIGWDRKSSTRNPLEYDQILKGGKFWGDVNGGICPKILCWLRDVQRLTGYILKVSTRLFQCKSAEMRAWNRRTWSVDPTRKKIRSRLCARENKTKRHGKIQRAPRASQSFSAMPHLEAVKCLSRSWCRSVCQTKGTHWKWDTTTSAEHISKEQPRD